MAISVEISGLFPFCDAIHYPVEYIISACWAQNRRTSPNSLLAKIPRNRNEPWRGTILLIHTYTPPQSRPSSFRFSFVTSLSCQPLLYLSFAFVALPRWTSHGFAQLLLAPASVPLLLRLCIFFCCCCHSLFCASLITLRPGPSPTLFFSFAPRLLVPPPSHRFLDYYSYLITVNPTGHTLQSLLHSVVVANHPLGEYSQAIVSTSRLPCVAQSPGPVSSPHTSRPASCPRARL